MSVPMAVVTIAEPVYTSERTTPAHAKTPPML
jgi:hypothetical protein